jgi:hypothetical protein
MAMAAFMGVTATVRQHEAYIVFLEQSDLNAFCLDGRRRDTDISNMQFPPCSRSWIQQQTSLWQSKGYGIRGSYIRIRQVPSVRREA